MSQNFILELYADATIAQKGTEVEKKALRAELTRSLESHGSVYHENSMEGLWYKLGKINVGDAAIRADVTRFIESERKLKGGDAGSYFEERFQIIERNFALAVVAEAKRNMAQQAVTAQVRVEETQLKKDQKDEKSNTSKSEKAIVLDTEPRSVTYSRDFLKSSMTALQAVQIKLKDRPEFSKMLEEVIKNPSFQAVSDLQTAIKKIDQKAIVSPLGSKKNGDPDGWFGPLTLRAIQLIANPKTESVSPVTPGETPSGTPKSSAPSRNGETTPADKSAGTPAGVVKPTTAPEKAKDTYDEDLRQLQKLIGAWKSATKGADMLSSSQDRESNSQLLDAAMKALAASMIDFNAKYIAGKTNAFALQNAEYLKSTNNDIALYLRGMGKVDNKHYRDPISAETILKGTLGAKLNSPTLPTQDQLMKGIDGNTKTLIVTMLNAKMKQGKTFEEALGETLGNPTIKGAWDKVYDAGFSKYEKDMIAAIGKVDTKSLTSQEKVSLDQLRDMYGTTGWFDFKDSNKAKMAMGRDQLFAVGLGIAGAVFTATAIGSVAGVPMIVAASALVGGTLATGANMVLEGKVYSGKEFLQEESINVGTFLVGGILFKVVRSAEVIAKIGTKGALGAEMAGDYTLGVSVDQIRSQFQSVDVSLAESLKNNLVWALLPLAIRGGSMAYSKAREALATRTASRLQEAQARQALGDTNGANSVLAQVDSEINAARATEAPVTAPTMANQELFTTHISMNDIRKMRDNMRNNPNLLPKFIGADGKKWTIRKFSGRPGSEMLEIGPMGQPSLAQSVSIQEFTASVNANMQKFKAPVSEPAPATPEPAPATPEPLRAAAPAEAAPTGPAATATATFEKFFKNFESKLKKLKEGESVTLGDTTVTLKDGDYIFKSGTGESLKFPVSPDGLKALKRHIAENVAPDQMIKGSLAKDFNGTVETMVKKEIRIGDQTYRISKDDAGKFVLEKK